MLIIHKLLNPLTSIRSWAMPRNFRQDALNSRRTASVAPAKEKCNSGETKAFPCQPKKLFSNMENREKTPRERRERWKKGGGGGERRSRCSGRSCRRRTPSVVHSNIKPKRPGNTKTFITENSWRVDAKCRDFCRSFLSRISLLVFLCIIIVAVILCNYLVSLCSRTPSPQKRAKKQNNETTKISPIHLVSANLFLIVKATLKFSPHAGNCKTKKNQATKLKIYCLPQTSQLSASFAICNVTFRVWSQLCWRFVCPKESLRDRGSLVFESNTGHYKSAREDIALDY